ncbi:MAG: insulinase family protein [Flavobacteriales bacterium]|nr:insulinase family protein [Flavobacteriales bacterium]
MNKFLVTSILLLVVNVMFSQIDTTKYVQDTPALTDTVIGNTHYKISLNNEFKNKMPKPATHVPIQMLEASTFVLINGLKVILVENNKLPYTSFKLYFDYSDVLLKERKGADLIFAELWGKNGKKNKEADISDYKFRTGTNIIVDDKSIYIEGLSKYKSKNISLISDLAMQFNFTEDQFEETKSKLIDSLYFASNRNEFIVDAVARNLMFGNNNPAGESFSVDIIDSLKSNDVREYYNSFFNPNNSYLMVYGDISMRELRRLVNKNFRNFRKGDIIKGYYPQPYNLPQIEIDFVENYNSDSLSVWMGNVVNKTSFDENWLFHKSSSIILFDEEIGLFSTKFLHDNKMNNLLSDYDDEGKFFAIEYDVSEKDVAKSVHKSIESLEKVNSVDPLDSLGFEIFKSRVAQNYIKGLSDPLRISDLYLMYYVTGFGKYIVPNLMEVVDTISLPSVSSLLKHKLKPQQLRIVISGKPGVAVPHLEKLGYKLNYYDQFGVATFPPSLDRAVPDSINVNNIINRYISASGGESKLKEVRRLLQWWVIDINNTKLYVKNKYMLPNKRLSTYSNKEVIVLKTVFNGEYGYVEKSGTITEIEGDNFLELSMERSIFPVMYYSDLGYALSLESQIPLKGEECYKVRAEAPYGQELLLYFRIYDGLLLRKEVIDRTTGGVINYTNYSDFKTFEDIIFPYTAETLIGGKKTIMTLTQIKINDENVRSRDFK